MKKIILAAIVVISADHHCFCQDQPDNQPKTREEYLQRAKSERIGGFVLLGLGGVGITIAATGKSSMDASAVIGVLGGALVIGSFAAFHASRINTQKAKHLSTSLNLEPLPSFLAKNNRAGAMPVISLKFGL